MSELIGSIIAGTLTILVLSYLIGENPLYRLALHIFVGILVGYATGIVVREILVGMALPKLISNPLVGLVPFVLGLLLLVKGFPQQAPLGNSSIAYLVGVGAAVALGGALLGTLGPQIEATGRAFSPASRAASRFGLLDGLMVLVGTVCSLLTFSFARPKGRVEGFPWPKVVNGAAWIGRVFLVVAFGLAFAGAITASLSIFVGRMQYVIDLALRAIGL
jgi:hypothetical protein